MTAQPPPAEQTRYRIGRSYTRARRFPWVVGKIQGWNIPFGPYTATQLGTLIGGLWLVVQTYPWWRPLGPGGVLVIAVPLAATWAVRHAKIDGRSPVKAIGGYLALLSEPACGRISGRTAKDPRPRTITGTVRVAALPAPAPLPHHGAATDRPSPRAAAVAGTPARPARRARRTRPAPAPAGVARRTAAAAPLPAPTALQSLLAAATAAPDHE
jgi:hypothetical protein